MFRLTALFVLLSIPAWAGSSLSSVNVSETLTMTSPSAIISMTGVSSTANIRFISSTLVSSTNISATNITNAGVAKAWINFNGVGGCSIRGVPLNVSSCTRIATGQYGISFTTPLSSAFYSINCTSRTTAAGANASFVNFPTASPSPTTGGVIIQSVNGNSGSLIDSSEINCTVMGN